MGSLGYDQRTKVAIPGDAITASPGVCVYMADSWWPIVVGLLEGGLNDSFWDESTGNIEVGKDGILSFATQETEENCMFYGRICYHTEYDETGGDASAGYNNRQFNRYEGDFDSSVIDTPTNIIIPAGRWIIRAAASANRVDNHKLWWWNMTADEYLVNGLNALARSTSGLAESNQAILEGAFESNGTDVFRLLHWCQTARSTTGMGNPSTDTTENVYNYAAFERLGDVL